MSSVPNTDYIGTNLPTSENIMSIFGFVFRNRTIKIERPGRYAQIKN